MNFAGIPDFTSMDEAVAWCEEEIERFRAEGYQPRRKMICIPLNATEADRLCMTCRGAGQLTDVHEYGPKTICTCHRCGGSGLKT